MSKNRLPKQALQYEPKGGINVGRPRKSWKDQLDLEGYGTATTPNPSDFMMMMMMMMMVLRTYGLNKLDPEESSCLYRASMTIKTLYYPKYAQIYNS